MTNYFDDYNESYGRDYSGTKSRPIMSNAGQALESLFGGLRNQPSQREIPNYAALQRVTGSQAYSPFAPVGPVRQSSTQTPFTPAAPPERYNVNVLGEAVTNLLATAPGQAFMGTPGQQRGGVVSVDTGFGSFGLATIPANFQNFATYAREGTLSAITSILGHNYQQPVGDDPYAQPAGPVNNQDFLGNLGEGDFAGMLDNVIDGISAVGDTVSAPFVWAGDRFREANAIDRGRLVRNILATGDGSDWTRTVMMLTSIFDQSRFSWEGVVAKAQLQGKDPLSMLAQLWDLDEEIVRTIAANPRMTDEKVEALVKHEPYSYEPGVNVLVELGVTLAPIVAGAGLVRGTGFVAQGLKGATQIVRGSHVARAAGAGASELEALANGYLSLRELGLLGRVAKTAEYVRAWSLPKVWRGVQIAEAANRYSLMAGTGVRAGEWMFKQAAEILGNDEAIAMIDEWLWEMPLSQNPGLMLIDGFAVHPLRTLKSGRVAVGRVGARVFGGGDVEVSPAAAVKLGSIKEMPLEVVQDRLLNELGFDPAHVERLFGEDGAIGTATDLKNGLLYIAMQVVRERHANELRHLDPQGGIVARSEAFWDLYHDEGITLLRQALTGRGKDRDAIAHAIRQEFWTRKKVLDASELGSEGYIGPYDPVVALNSLAAWIRGSKLAATAADEAVVGLRRDVNLEFTRAFREHLASEYPKPGDIVSATDLNTLRQQVPRIATYGDGKLKASTKVPRITRRQLERMLDLAEADQAVENLEAARPATQAAPAIEPHLAGNPAAIAKAFKMREDSVRMMLETPPDELAGPIPADVARALRDVFGVTEADVRANPEIHWPQAARWWESAYNSAVQRGEGLATLGRLRGIVTERFAGAGTREAALDADAFARINDTISRPYTAAERINKVAGDIANERNDAVSAFVDEAQLWLDDPARPLRVAELGDVRVVEAHGFTVGDAVMVEQLAPDAIGYIGLAAEDAALLADAAAHPLEKAFALRAAMKLGWKGGNDVQRARLAELGSLEYHYEALVKQVLGDDVAPTRESVGQLTERAIASDEELTRLREVARSLAGSIDRSPTRQLTAEVREFYDRAAPLGERKIGVGPSGATVQTWRSLPLDDAGVIAANTAELRANIEVNLRTKLKASEELTTRLEAERRRVTTAAGREPAVDWPADPLGTFKTLKAAREAAQVARADGQYYAVAKVGERKWGLFRGTLKESAAAEPAGTVRSAPDTPPAREPAKAPPAPAEPPRIGTFADEPALGPGVERVPVSVLRRFVEIDREQTPKGGDLSVDLEALTADLRENGPREPLTLEYDPQTNTALLSDGNHRVVVAEAAGLAELPLKVEIVKRTQLEKDAGGVLPGFKPVDADAAPGATTPFTLRPSHLLRVAEEAAPAAEARWSGSWRPQEFEAAAEGAAADAPRLRSGYSWEQVPLDRLDRVPDLELAELYSRAASRATIAPDAVPAHTPKLVQVKATEAFMSESGGAPLEVPARPAYYTWTIDSANKADQNSLPVDTPDGGKWSTREAAKAAMLRWQEHRTADLRELGAQARHDLPYLEAERSQRSALPLDAEGNVIEHAGTLADAEAGYPRARYDARTYDDATLRRMAASKNYGPEVRAIFDAEVARREAGGAPEPLARNPEAPPPIVEQISQVQRIREAQVAALAREAEAQGAALTERTAAYEASRVLPGAEASAVEAYLATVKGGTRTDSTLAQRVARERFEKDLSRLSVEGLEKLVADRPTDALAKAALADKRAAVTPDVTTVPEVTFLDPADNKTPIRSRVVLVEADALLTSDEPGFPPTLQPRARGIRASSREQVQEYARDLQPAKLLGTTEGGSGMPVVVPEGAVLAGNGRTMAIRLAAKSQYVKYQQALGLEAAKYGYTPEQVAGMRRPMLVREVIDVDAPTAERLAWQLNEMPIGDLAPSVAASLTRADLSSFTVGPEQSLADAIKAPSNAGAVGKMIGRLPRDWHARYFDSAKGLNEPGAALLEASLISKLLRADDRAAPGFESARAVVFQLAEQGGEDIRRIANGLAEATAQVIKAYEAAEAGKIPPDILSFGDDLAPAVSRIISLRDSGLSMDGVVQALDNTTMFDAQTLTPQQTHLAKLLATSRTQREVREFMRAVARASEEGPVVGQEAMFANVPPADYTGLLNSGVAAWNAARRELGRSEIDYFPSTEPPYDVPLGTTISESPAGATHGPARMTQPLTADEVGPEIARRTIGEAAIDTPIDPLDVAVEAAALADYPAFQAELGGLIDSFRAMDEPVQRVSHAELLNAANAGTATAAELRFLWSISAGWRRTKAGALNMKFNPKALNENLTAEYLSSRWAPDVVAQRAAANLATNKVHLRELEAMEPQTPERLAKIEEIRRTIAEMEAEPTARVIRPDPQKPLTAAELADDVGPDVPYDVPSAAVDEAIASGQHTVIVGDNPTVNRAVRKAVGGPAVEDAKRRLYEVYAPDAKVAAERIEAQLQAAKAELEAVRRQIDELPTRDLSAEMPDRPSVFPDEATRGLWDRLMRGSDTDQLAATMGSVEPSSLSVVMDAIESIDRGVYADPVTGVGLTAAEALQLRTHLMRLANGTLEGALARAGKARRTRFTQKLGEAAPDRFDADELTERAALIQDELGQYIRTEGVPVSEGFLGAQYIIAKPPTKGALAPRILFRDRFVDDIAPGLLEELATGRMEDLPRRVSTSRFARLVDRIAGPRPERIIHAQARARWTDAFVRYGDPDMNQAALDKIGKTVDAAFDKFHDRMESTKLGHFNLYRRPNLMGPELFNKLVNEAVTEVYGTTKPAWYDAMLADGKTPFNLWRVADNRIRQGILATSDGSIATALERLYGKAADLGERPGRWTTVVYHTARFLMDIRWLGLEQVEPAMIALPRGGIGGFVEASFLRKTPVVKVTDKLGLTSSTKAPLGFGQNVSAALLREYAHWANMADLEQGSKVRIRYLLSELKREQPRPFRAVVKEMMSKEPGLRRMIDEADGGNIDRFLERLDRDWQLMERGTREFATQTEAAAFFSKWREHGVIDDATYRELIKARKYTTVPEIEAELAKVANDPLTTALLERLEVVNNSLFHDLTAMLFGQENRSNIQRVVNHPLLYWPISYQIKATKWLARLMLEEFGGADTGATVAGVFQQVHDEHRKRFATDERYRANYEANKTLYFIAGMLLPILPTELGVSLSPYTRMIVNPDYQRPFGLLGVGPIYTMLSLVPRLIHEQTQPGRALSDLPGPVNTYLGQAFPQSITIDSTRGPKPVEPTSTIEAEQQRLVAPGSVQIPMMPLEDRRTP